MANTNRAVNVSLHLRVAGAEPIELIGSLPTVQRLAVKWSKVLQNRHRWPKEDGYQSRKEQAAEEITVEFPILDDKNILKSLARASVIEVSLPKFKNESTHWSLRIMPWEFLLSAVTSLHNRIEGQIIVRVLPVPKHRSVRAKKIVDFTPLIIESTPGKLDGIYEFGSERKLIELNLGLDNIEPYIKKSPTSKELAEEIERVSPHLLHFMGFDSHQGSSFLGEAFERSRMDGYYLSDSSGGEISYNAEAMANIITSAKQKPVLVNFNIYNSASRLCPLALSEGAGAAIGFQDDVDDLLAESFFASFYKIWASAENYNLLTAFVYAINEVKEMGLGSRLRGSGIVLWSRSSLIDSYSDNEAQLSKIHETWKNEQSTEINLESSAALTANTTGTGDGLGRDLLDTTIKPLERLNYSILHNNGNLFENFLIKKTQVGMLKNVYIEVKLFVGAVEFPYRGTVDLERTNVDIDINEEIRIPLGWESLRNLRESVRSTLSVRVALPWDRDGSVYEKTFAIEIATLEEWSDTDSDRHWLPSFIQPRDHCVINTVANARRYLVAITDDPEMGFDGYQSYDPSAVDPGELIDSQVRSIWTAILLENKLQYINPPPSYYAQSQRLRSPSEVVKKNHGTCIDLTLMLASCLEYIEIHPVVFLLNGHAFPGYWRNEYHRNRFNDGYYFNEIGDEAVIPRRNESEAPWVFDADDYVRIVGYVEGGAIVPMESVYLTQSYGFFEACDAGIENLSERSEFHSMQDIQLSRISGNNVTPIPMVES